MSVARVPLVKSAGTSLAVFVVFGAVAGLVPNPVHVRMVPRTPLDYLFLAATAAFAGAFVYQQATVDEPVGEEFAFGGVVGGFLAFACPICNAVLVALFGSSALMTYFDPLRPFLGAVSVVFFAG